MLDDSNSTKQPVIEYSKSPLNIQNLISGLNISLRSL